MLARLATVEKIPVITSASEPTGTNGPLMPEIHALAPHAIYVPRKGEVNAWDNADFVRAVEKTGKKTLVISGVWTSVCVMFPALDAKLAGYNVYARAKWLPAFRLRASRGGVIPTTTNAVLFEVHRTWARPDAGDIAELYSLVSPNYQAVVENYLKAQEVAKKQPATKPGTGQ